VRDQVSDGDFYRHDHRLIFRAIAKLATRTRRSTSVIAEQLDKEGRTSQVGGLGYLGELAKNTPSVANIKAYARSFASGRRCAS
jgi:replicative DNA helicase